PSEQMPHLLVLGWWNLGSAKMSKSAVNIIVPFIIADKYGADALRYYLMSDIATGRDADFSEERLIERYNADLANSLGNLLNRTLNMLQKYRAGRAKKITSAVISTDVNSGYAAFLREYQQAFALHEISGVVESWQSHVDFFNKFIENHAPWALARSTTGSEELDEVLYDAAESLRIIAILISPVLPKAAHGIFDQLNWKMELSGKEERFSLADAEWGRLPDGHVVGKPVPLFPRIEVDEGV